MRDADCVISESIFSDYLTYLLRSTAAREFTAVFVSPPSDTDTDTDTDTTLQPTSQLNHPRRPTRASRCTPSVTEIAVRCWRIQRRAPVLDRMGASVAATQLDKTQGQATTKGKTPSSSPCSACASPHLWIPHAVDADAARGWVVATATRTMVATVRTTARGAPTAVMGMTDTARTSTAMATTRSTRTDTTTTRSSRRTMDSTATLTTSTATAITMVILVCGYGYESATTGGEAAQMESSTERMSVVDYFKPMETESEMLSKEAAAGKTKDKSKGK
ncbi:hypothetical protein ON010_g13991 [Phytophthora cinnamomi]|nr:hypothetical protein ON010_g13991 [Phytophthora cinnamomi]